MKIKYLFLIFILLSFKKTAPLYLSELRSEEEFNLLCSEPLTNKYSDVTSVKVVYDLKTKKLYFINSAFYQFHYEFCQAQIDGNIYLGRFNVDNYSKDSPDRRYLLCNINYFPHLSTYALELSPSDYMSRKDIEFLLAEIKSKVVFKENLSLMLSTVRLQNMRPEFSKEVDVLLPDDIYKNMKFQTVSEGETVGTLRFVEDLKKESHSLMPSDIIVIRETPLVLPHVAGVIISEFQTPLSHLTLLGRNRKMPVVAIPNVFNNEEIKLLSGKNVQLKVTLSQYFLRETTKNPTVFEPGRRVILPCDLKVDTLLEISKMHRNSSDFAGNKANNFAKLYQLSRDAKFKTPEAAFSIPFYFYNQHAIQSGAMSMIDRLLSDPNYKQNQDTLQLRLKEIRNAIQNTSVSSDLLTSTEQKIKSLGNYTSMRFRSSTNAEDAKGFSGAGLYASKTGILGSDEQSIEDAVRKVWASLWSYNAFMEREYFNIDQENVQMGILVHRAFPDEEVNGVVITKNLYRKGYLGFVVNAQIGNENVVNPTPGVVCDQFIAYPESSQFIQPDETIIDVITYSSLGDGKLVMTEEEIQRLVDEINNIKMALWGRIGRQYAFEEFALDLEFKLDAVTRQLYIKQFRIYND
jgi:pyruvate, water dikinase